MAAKQAKKAKATSAKPLAGKKVAFAGKFGYGNWSKEQLKDLAKFHGGKVVNPERATPDILVAGAGGRGGVPGAVAKVQKKHPAVQVLDEDDFYRLVTPTADALDAILRKCPHDWDYWRSMSDCLENVKPRVNLSGRDYRNLDLSQASLEYVNVNGCDFRGAKLKSASFGKVRDSKFDGATLDGLDDAEDCSLRNAKMNGGSANKWTRCDFTGAEMTELWAYDLKATDCTFRKADLSRCDLQETTFTNCDFAQAKLIEANLENARLAGANLAGADLTGADLAKARLSNADFTGASLRNAILSGATLTGAKLDGADFEGANLTDVNLKGVNVSKAKNILRRPVPAPGPNLKRLAKVARKAKEFTTSLELELGKDESVVLKPTKYTASYISVDYEHVVPDGRRAIDSYMTSPNFIQAMLDLADRWARGTPKFETLTVGGKKLSLKGEELRDLAHAAWCEALGLPVPDAAAFQAEKAQLAGRSQSFRDTLLAELRGGGRGVAKWNARPHKDRARVGPLRDADFSGSKLARAELDALDLRDAKFDGASLVGASLWNCELKGTSFAGANLNGARFGCRPCAGTVFAGASMVRADLSSQNCRGANFRDADLTKADLSGADLCGADLSGAILEKANLEGAKFDQSTRFPAGFKPPATMNWKGTGPRPGVRAAKVAAAGSMDFDTFYANLEKKVDVVRMKKAKSMLKADRFQLFADVTDTGLVGIVKSQTDNDLVYCCRLAADGQFGCGTQNLKPCGGLQGALCKHLLVLIAGLAKAGRIDPATVYAWADASQSNQPALEKDGMSETFLKYKGAEAGEIDWRPTETVPEDFYAM